MNTCEKLDLEKNLQCKEALVRSATVEAKALNGELSKCVAA